MAPGTLHLSISSLPFILLAIDASFTAVLLLLLLSLLFIFRQGSLLTLILTDMRRSRHVGRTGPCWQPSGAACWRCFAFSCRVMVLSSCCPALNSKSAKERFARCDTCTPQVRFSSSPTHTPPSRARTFVSNTPETNVPGIYNICVMETQPAVKACGGRGCCV